MNEPNSEMTDFFGYLATILGGTIGMLIGFALMVLVLFAIGYPAYARWKISRDEKRDQSSSKNHRRRAQSARL